MKGESDVNTSIVTMTNKEHLKRKLPLSEKGLKLQIVGSTIRVHKKNRQDKQKNTSIL